MIKNFVVICQCVIVETLFEQNAADSMVILPKVCKMAMVKKSALRWRKQQFLWLLQNKSLGYNPEISSVHNMSDVSIKEAARTS